MGKISGDQKETAIEALRVYGTMQKAAEIAGVTVRTLNVEMTRSEIFKRRVLEARGEGKSNVADKAIEMIKLYASGTVAKTDRNVLIANIALANAYEPGFRGVTQIQGKVEHDVRVITAVPRPKYDIEIKAVEPKQLSKGKVSKEDKAKLREINRGKPVYIKDKLKK
jgi:hypothetical protein